MLQPKAPNILTGGHGFWETAKPSIAIDSAYSYAARIKVSSFMEKEISSNSHMSVDAGMPGNVGKVASGI